jgi:hypothetical protein
MIACRWSHTLLAAFSVGLFAACGSVGHDLDTAAALASAALRDRPLPVRVTHTLGTSHVDAEDVQSALRRLNDPPLGRWTEVLHYARLWRPEAFPQEGEDARAIFAPLLRSGSAQALFGQHYHLATRNGVEFRPGAREKRDGELHQDGTLATLALAGAPLDTTVEVEARTLTVGDMARAALANAYLSQPEWEWTTAALALCLQPPAQWENKFGQRMSMDDACRRLCETPLGQGSCCGMHVPFALAVLLQADATGQILGVEAHGAAHARLLDAAARLAARQDEAGSWDAAWGEHNPSAEAIAGQPELARLVATSHALEWLAIAPADVQIPDAQVAAACAYLLHRLQEAASEELRRLWPAYSHAGHALRWWCPQGWSAAAAEWAPARPMAVAAAAGADSAALESTAEPTASFPAPDIPMPTGAAPPCSGDMP